MALTAKPTRYAHPDGHCDVCYITGEKKGLLTCGSDGDIRYWLNAMDDDPESICIAEQVLCVTTKGDKIYVGNDNNTVQILTQSDFNKAGILTSFSSTVSALATNKKSNLIVSGGCDFLIRVSDVNTLNYTELSGHQAPILGLSLDPKEVYVASSSADGSIKVWNIQKKETEHTFYDVIPKSNSFFLAQIYGTPTFECSEGKYLAYPYEKEIVVTKRDTWTEEFCLKHSTMKADFNICKFSECGTLLAASSVYGEIVVWNVANQNLVGYIEHPANSKITSFAWHPDKPNEISFCDSEGQLGCIDIDIDRLNVKFDDDKNNDSHSIKSMPIDDDDDEDDENVISLSKIKAELEPRDDDDRSSVSSVSVKKYETKFIPPEINLQEHFQPTSTPSHLLSHFMVWNDVGIVTYYRSEDNEDSSIEVEFHETATYHSMRIVNYLNHTMAALSTQALVLSCPSSEDNPSKVVVVSLQGWGSGTKEWTIDLPENEDSHCVAAGDNFVAVATSRRFLRIFTISGVQRQILAIPGPVVTMNAYKRQLAVVYHRGIGGSKDQNMELMWIKMNGRTLRSQTLPVPLSPETKLRWVGFTDTLAPVIYDTEDILKIYYHQSSLWSIACDMKSMLSGQNDHYFLIGISNGFARAIVCKGSHYPVTSPRPFAISVPLSLPLCEPDSEKTKLEIKINQLDHDSNEENAATLELIALSCRAHAEYRAVDICENFASQEVIEKAIKYTARINRQPLVKKLQSIAESKYSNDSDEVQNDDVQMIDDFSKPEDDIELQEDKLNLISTVKKPEFELKPLPFINPRRSNPFAKTKSSPKVSGLEALGTRDTNSSKDEGNTLMIKGNVNEKAKKSAPEKETFVVWFNRVRDSLQKEHPEMNVPRLTKLALSLFKEKEKTAQPVNDKVEEPGSKKRKFEDIDAPTNGTPNTASAKLANFARKT